PETTAARASVSRTATCASSATRRKAS
ncbi:MAG: hypothetical protein AVDCRST_MAG55-1645, partial [uncultured Rubrobacteraceae bacterium]